MADAQQDDEFVKRALERIKGMNEAAEALTSELGLPKEAKYDVLSVMFGTPGHASGHYQQPRNWLGDGLTDPAADREKKQVDDWMKRHSRGQYSPKPESRGL